MNSEHVDVLIVGGASRASARRIRSSGVPVEELMLLEARDVIGGTWDLFAIPASARLRHVHAGLPLPALTGEKALADGPSILKHICDTAREAGIDKKIRFTTRWCAPSGAATRAAGR
ncbi:MAG: hypothetical protein IPN77_04730 [Sandaracinaceae bacterium]|nr:hypothetical protein [Sandaracinaceae bacterium]